MSAVSTYESTDRELKVLGRLPEPAPVIDLAAERRRRQVAEADLQRAIARHPAGSALATADMGGKETDGPPVQYRIVVPLYAKVVGWVLAFALVIGIGGALGAAFRPAPFAGETYTHSVASGESLWGLAAGLGSARALEDVVEDIRALNGLDDATLHPGQEILLPLE